MTEGTPNALHYSGREEQAHAATCASLDRDPLSSHVRIPDLFAHWLVTAWERRWQVEGKCNKALLEPNGDHDMNMLIMTMIFFF